jgi:hypothetical protein
MLLMVCVFLVLAFNAFAQTTLTATPGTATLDGVEAPGEWTSNAVTTTRGLTIKAMMDAENLYVLATWPDATRSVAKNSWIFDGTNWNTEPVVNNIGGDEDRVGFVWQMKDAQGQSLTPEGANCAAFCHSPQMRTNGGRVDVWHWKAARFNPAGFTDDKYWDDCDTCGDGGRHGDDGSGSGSRNRNDAQTGPKYMAASDPGANVDFLADDAAVLAAFDPFGVMPGTVDTKVDFDSSATFSVGDMIPGRRVQIPTGNRASVRSAGKWADDMWTVEFSRKLAGEDGPGGPEDFAVVPGDSVEFTTDTMDDVSDHTQHAFTGGAADTRVFTLRFPMVTSVESRPANQIPVSYVLNQNFPNPFNPSTAITFDVAQPGRAVLKIYNLLGQQIVTLIDGNLEAGRHKMDFDASNLSSGIYLYRLSINGFTDMKKMAFIK